MTPRLELVSFDICPYVERSRIVLLEGLPHEVKLIELSSKPAWFLEVSPMGRVPVLLLDGRPACCSGAEMTPRGPAPRGPAPPTRWVLMFSPSARWSRGMTGRSAP